MLSRTGQMKVTIFSRLVFGYLLIFGLVLVLSGYVVFRIGQFNEITQSVLMTNNLIVDYSARLTDAILSQVRNERKFIISKDKAFYDQFLKFKGDFDRYLEEAMSISDVSQMKDSWSAIKGWHQQYQSLLGDELRYLEASKSYPQGWYRQEKERFSNSILQELEKVQSTLRQNTNEKIKILYEAGVSARQMAIVMTAVLLVSGMTLSYLINRSITEPIAVLVKKTREIGKGDFKGDVHLSSPPELVELAQAFNLMCKKLGELDQMKSDFFSTVAHELRTPLSSIKMGLSLLTEGREGSLTEGQKELLTLIQKENNRIIGLVNAILDLSKIEAGMVTYKIEPQNVAPLIDQVVKEMGPLIEAKRIRFESELAERLPVAKIDTERFLQVLRNVIGNALKFTPEGGHVKVSVRTIDQGLQITVTDTGPGIPEKNLTTIFEKFQQVDRRDSYKVKGTGLGLAIAKQVVTHHGGRIWAESQLGRGSTFFIQLPA
ncbi:MAG: ATP-binding protein [Thermodesulfobacteriota bacterium]